MTIFAELDEAGFVLKTMGRADPPDMEGPLPPPPGPEWRLSAEPIKFGGAPTATSRMWWDEDLQAARWVETGTLEQLRQAKKDEINAAHELANLTSFTFQGKEIQANPHSMRQIEITNGGVLARGAMRNGWLGAWKTLDNSYVAIPDVATWRAFYDAIEETGTANYLKAQELKALVDTKTKAEEIALISWNPPENAP